MKKKYIWLTLWVLFTIFIFSRSLKPAPASAQESFGISSWITSIVQKFINMPYDELLNLCTYIVRKGAHVAEFAIQSCLICGFFNCSKGKMQKNISWILFLGLFTACTDEAIQLFVEGRAGMVFDVFIDFTGTIAGLALSVIFSGITTVKRKRNTKKMFDKNICCC